MSDVLLAERSRLVARIAEIDALLAPTYEFVRDNEPEQTYCGYGIEHENGSHQIGQAWCSTWVRKLTFPTDLDRDAWVDVDDGDDLYAVVRTWYYLVTYGGNEWDVHACSAYQICTDPAHPDTTDLEHWLDYSEGAGHGWHKDAEIHAMAVADDPPTIESWNDIVDKAGESWAMLNTGDD